MSLKPFHVVLFIAVALCASQGRAEELSPTITAVPANAVKTEFPDFDYNINNGLYATVTALQSFKNPDIKNERKFKLKNIEGFKKDIEVRALMQDEPAPLVIIFLGLASKSKDAMARLWQYQLHEAGHSVMVFDSVFRASFNERSCHGVCGNVDAEARVAAKVISAFIHHPDVEGSTTKIHLLGASYGGILALNYARLAKLGVIKQAPEKVLVFSPPISMRTSAVLLDKYYDEDTQKASFFDLFELSGHKPVEAGKKIPFTESQMRAGIGYIFHADLKDAVNLSRNMYKYEMPKTEDGKKTRCFTRFIEQVVYPYWRENKGVNTVEELWEYGNLEKLLKACGDNVHAIITEDDPLNDKTLLSMMKRDVPSSKLTVLPRGGHLGFLGTKWARERVVKFFE